MNYQFGNTSSKRLSTCHEDLIAIMQLAISRSSIDFGITEGHRSIERQQDLFNQGKSKIDGINRKGKHNYDPSLAVDIYIYHSDVDLRRKLAYDRESLAYVAGVVQSCAKELYDAGEVSHIIRWGGNWDRDGVILHDQSFDDMPHFELINPA